MRSIAETGKDGQLAHTTAAAGSGGSVASSRCSCCLCQPQCGCGSDVLHAGGRSLDQANRWFSAQPLPKFKGFYKRFFLALFFTIWTNIFSQETIFATIVYYHSFSQCCRRLRLKIRKERIISEGAPV